MIIEILDQEILAKTKVENGSPVDVQVVMA